MRVFVQGVGSASANDTPEMVEIDTSVPAPALAATSRVALTLEGPFLPIADAIDQSAKLRAELAVALDLDAIRRWRRVRVALFVAILPLLMLAELDRELASAKVAGAGPRIVADLFVAAIVALDLARRVPRHPKTTAILMLAGAARFLLFVSKSCGHAHPLLWAATAVALAGGVTTLVLAPSNARVAGAILHELGITASDVRAARMAPRPSNAFVLASCGVALALPVLLVFAKWAAIGLVVQAALFCLYALVPSAIELVFERRARRPMVPLARSLFGAAIGLALTIGLTGGARYTLDAGAFVARCRDPAAYQDSGMRRALEQQQIEVTRNLDRDRERLGLFALNVLVVPLVEERVYRGLLQRVLALRWGTARGIAMAALLFGAAHLGVYRYAIWQTALLGVSFGVAYSEAGLVASALAHALWNLYILS